MPLRSAALLHRVAFPSWGWEPLPVGRSHSPSLCPCALRSCSPLPQRENGATADRPTDGAEAPERPQPISPCSPKPEAHGGRWAKPNARRMRGQGRQRHRRGRRGRRQRRKEGRMARTLAAPKARRRAGAKRRKGKERGAKLQPNGRGWHPQEGKATRATRQVQAARPTCLRPAPPTASAVGDGHGFGYRCRCCCCRCTAYGFRCRGWSRLRLLLLLLLVTAYG